MLDNYRELVGAIHIHSKFSDGTKSIPDIAEIASKAGLDFLMVTDHMTLEPLHLGLEGFYGKTAVFVGYEINDSDDKNHFLAFGLNSVLPPNLTAKQYVDEVDQRGGLGIIAHPDEVRTKLVKYPSYPWTAWEADRYHGIEIWNHMSQWMESLNRRNKVKQSLVPRRALTGPTERILKLWDEVSRTRRIVGVGSIDVHAFPYRIGPIRVTIFPYKVQFRAIRTHVYIPESVPGELASLKSAVYAALRKCRAFVSNYRWGDARGFVFQAVSGGSVAPCGDELEFEEDVTLSLKVPQLAEIRLIKDGMPIFSGAGTIFEIRAPGSGLYRAEIYRGRKAWIFSNHIAVKDSRPK